MFNPTLSQRLSDEANLCRNDGAEDIATLLDEAARELAKREWQPIETAPKDGTRILVAAGELVCTSFWDESLPYRVKWHGYFIESLPLFWMPLPDAPSRSESMGG